MHLLVKELGDVRDFVVDRPDLLGHPEFIQEDRLGDAEIDPFQKTDVAQVLPAAFADDRQDAKLVAVVEHRREIVGDRQVGAVDVARNDRDGIGVDPFAIDGFRLGAAGAHCLAAIGLDGPA